MAYLLCIDTIRCGQNRRKIVVTTFSCVRGTCILMAVQPLDQSVKFYQ